MTMPLLLLFVLLCCCCCCCLLHTDTFLAGVALGYVGVAVLKQGQRSTWKSLGIPEPQAPRTLSGRSLQLMQSWYRFFSRYGFKILVSLSVVVCVNTVGTVVFVISEDWGLIEALYFSTVMSTTIAVASEDLTQAFTIWFTIPYCITGTVIMAFALGMSYALNRCHTSSTQYVLTTCNFHGIAATRYHRPHDHR
jgi:hypothetical protein